MGKVLICLEYMIEVFCQFLWYSGFACDSLLSYYDSGIHISIRVSDSLLNDW